MAPPLDSSTDTLVAALRTLARQAINAAMTTEMGGKDAVVQTVGFPSQIGLLANTRLPLLCVYVTENRVRPFSSAFTYRRATVTFDYYLPATGQGDLDVRWPMLGRVWEELSFAVCRGTWTDGGAKSLLDDADVVDVLDETMRVQYAFAESGQFTYPFFRASIDIDYNARPVDTSDYADADELNADYNLDEHVANPLVESLTEAEA